jgi:hypothetical protein
MIADAISRWSEAATKQDVEKAERRLESRIDALETRQLRWTLTFFVPLWIGMLGALVALVLKI